MTMETAMTMETGQNCLCEVCRNNKSFNFPKELLESFRTGDVVIFAGAGVSTEGKTVLPYTFYEEIAEKNGIDCQDNPSFPELMSTACSKPDGRQKMLISLKKRFNYIKSFGELYRDATEFHRELSTIFQIEHIITTNWDDYFEVECGATPFVSPEDFGLWRLPGRKVFKIHGSINSLGSIVATKEDYEQCYDNLTRGVIGSQLKTILATKTVVYVGYSFSDFDFVNIHKILTDEMKGMRPHSYIVTIDERSSDKFEALKITPIITSGAHFLRVVKMHLMSDGSLLPDEAFDGLWEVYKLAAGAHEKISGIDILRHPTAILTACYQDGMMHSLERMDSLKITGEYSSPDRLIDLLRLYKQMRKERMSKRSFADVSYIDGYLKGLSLLLTPPRKRRTPPLFYAYGYEEEPATMREYNKYLKQAPHVHKAVYNWCSKLLERDPRFGPGIVYHHKPILL